jgi:putative ABC transport system permease protein
MAVIPVRRLLRAPWFTFTAVLTIALGLGTCVTIFSVVDRALLRALPYHNPDRLVWIASLHATRGSYSKSSAWDFDAWRGRSTVFEAVEAYVDRAYTLTGTQYPEGLVGWQFTPTLFATLGTAPALGRTFVESDGAPDRNNVVILSDALWRRRFAASTDVIGHVLQLDGREYTVVGVMPPGFTPVPWRAALDAADAFQRDARRPQAAVAACDRPAAAGSVARARRGGAPRRVKSGGSRFPGYSRRLDRVRSSAARLLHW